MLGYTHTPLVDTPPGQTPPWPDTSLGRHPPPGQTPPWSPWADTPFPSRWLLQRTVRILLECILVSNNLMHSTKLIPKLTHKWTVVHQQNPVNYFLVCTHYHSFNCRNLSYHSKEITTVFGSFLSNKMLHLCIVVNTVIIFSFVGKGISAAGHSNKCKTKFLN